jgi:hypothetical protein
MKKFQELIDDLYDRVINPATKMKPSAFTPPIKPVRVVIAFLGLGMLAATMESATSPRTDPTPYSMKLSLGDSPKHYSKS